MFYICIEHKNSGRYSITFASKKHVNKPTHTYNKVTYSSLKRFESLVWTWDISDIQYLSYGVAVHYHPKS